MAGELPVLIGSRCPLARLSKENQHRAMDRTRCDRHPTKVLPKSNSTLPGAGAVAQKAIDFRVRKVKQHRPRGLAIAGEHA
jgi:hypothetical protein